MMSPETVLRWSWSNILTKKRADALVARFGDLDRALAAMGEELLTELGCRQDTAMNVLNRLEEFDPVAYEKELKKRDLTLISIEDEEYPQALKTIADPPMFLYVRGDSSILDQPCLALVGTREMSDYGKRVTESIVPDVVKAGVVTVSGLAYGIDALVAKETIRAGGKTVAVLGHGLAKIYPKGHSALGEDIVASGGLLLSEFPLDTVPDKFTFPSRNRIIAGLTLGTVVLEAAEDSGSLITAELALDYNRDVFAVPGQIFDPHYAGCHRLIARGTAKLVTSARDVLEEIGIAVSSHSGEQTAFVPGSKEEETMYASLTAMPQSLDDLAVRVKLDAAGINATLTLLELRGAAKNVGGGKWVRA